MKELGATYNYLHQLVLKKDNKFVPLFNANDVNRDQFFNLRKQLISLGCPQNDVLPVAKKLCMEILQINNEEKYLQYILEDTYHRCKQNIFSGGRFLSPIHDIPNDQYSHINLFSSIYGFEIEYIKSKGISTDIADIGCGDGVFARLARDHDIDVVGYEIEKPLICHNVKIQLIKDFYDIRQPHECLIYNHVLEHNSISPDLHIKLVINHFEENIKKNKLKLIIISLPMHLHIPSHMASKHKWVCTDQINLDENLKKLLQQHSLKIFNPALSFKEISNNYKLTVKNKLGVYVLEKY